MKSCSLCQAMLEEVNATIDSLPSLSQRVELVKKNPSRHCNIYKCRKCDQEWEEQLHRFDPNTGQYTTIVKKL
jgi:hypothetical protein